MAKPISKTPAFEGEDAKAVLKKNAGTTYQKKIKSSQKR